MQQTTDDCIRIEYQLKHFGRTAFRTVLKYMLIESRIILEMIETMLNIEPSRDLQLVMNEV